MRRRTVYLTTSQLPTDRFMLPFMSFAIMQNLNSKLFSTILDVFQCQAFGDHLTAQLVKLKARRESEAEIDHSEPK